MAGTYDDIIGRDASDDPLVPTPVSREIIQDLPAHSAVLQNARRVTMSAKTDRMPVLDALPEAYFVSGDTGLKQTASQDWENLTLVAEELAVVVPIPDAYLSDAQVPIWDEVRPRIVEAMGSRIDRTVLFESQSGVSGVTWAAPLVPTAVSAGNTVEAGTGVDLGVDVASLAELLESQGVFPNGALAQPGFEWRLRGIRTETGLPIFAPSFDQATPSRLYGWDLETPKNGVWAPTVAQLLLIDWQKVLIGLRQDITFRMFTEGIITDESGAVVLNLMQQDTVALRAVMRLAFQVATPATRMAPDGAFPVGVLTPPSGA